jgi:hypothetical protein
MEPNWVGIAVFAAALIALNAFVIYQWWDLARYHRLNRTPRAAWMFEDNPDGTLSRDMQLLRMAVARFHVAIVPRRHNNQK